MPAKAKPRTRPRNKPPTDAERAARREREREQMREAIAALRSSEGWQRWLTVRRHFHSYSFHNQLLIAHQRPAATRVAGYRKWLELGYVVRKGERAIRIWAPCPPSKKQVARWKEEGAKLEEMPRTYFRLVPVFDRGQVQELPDFPGGSAPLDPPHQPIAGDGLADRFEPLAAFGRDLGLSVSVEQIPGSARGYHEPATGRVVIEAPGPGFSANAQVAVLAHELAHALVRIDRRDGDPKLDYASEEVVVESVAYSVCASLGLDTAGQSVPYMAGWAESAEGDPIEAYAELIDRLARRIEAAAAAQG